MTGKRWLRAAALWLGAGLLLPGARIAEPDSSPDTWGPFSDERVVSPSGRHYAVLRSRKGVWPGPFELVRRREGAPPIEPATAGYRLVDDGAGGQRREPISVDRDPADALVVRGRLSQLPMDAAVLDDPLGIVFFDHYAFVGRRRVLWFVDRTGRKQWQHSLKSLYGGDPKGSLYSTSSVWWSAAWGADGALGIAWVLSHGGEFRAVALESGEVSTPGPDVLAALCARGEDAARAAVMDAVLARRDLALKPFLSQLVPLTVDDRQPLAIRLRAALLCRRAGDRLDHTELFRRAASAEDLEVAMFAAMHLPEIGEDEDPLAPLVAVLARLEEPLNPREGLAFILVTARWTPGCVAAFRRQGGRGLTRLRRALDAADAPPDALISLGVIWWKLGQTGLPERLRSLIRTGDEEDANAALNALIDSEPTGLTDILLDLARAGTADDVRLALYFRDHPHQDAIPPLERMLAAEHDDDWEVNAIREALEACRR